MYPPFPIPGFAPNFTGSTFFRANISWYEFQKSVGQQIEDTVSMVSNAFVCMCVCVCVCVCVCACVHGIVLTVVRTIEQVNGKHRFSDPCSSTRNPLTNNLMKSVITWWTQPHRTTYDFRAQTGACSDSGEVVPVSLVLYLVFLLIWTRPIISGSF